MLQSSQSCTQTGDTPEKDVYTSSRVPHVVLVPFASSSTRCQGAEQGRPGYNFKPLPHLLPGPHALSQCTLAPFGARFWVGSEIPPTFPPHNTWRYVFRGVSWAFFHTPKRCRFCIRDVVAVVVVIVLVVFIVMVVIVVVITIMIVLPDTTQPITGPPLSHCAEAKDKEINGHAAGVGRRAFGSKHTMGFSTCKYHLTTGWHIWETLAQCMQALRGMWFAARLGDSYSVHASTSGHVVCCTFGRLLLSACKHFGACGLLQVWATLSQCMQALRGMWFAARLGDSYSVHASTSGHVVCCTFGRLLLSACKHSGACGLLQPHIRNTTQYPAQYPG